MDNHIASLLSNSTDTAVLRNAVNSGEKAANNETIQQFEALFLQNMLKSMRTASLSSGLLSNDGVEFYQDMYDQQIASQLAGRGVLGIGQLIGAQLGISSGSESAQAVGRDRVLYSSRAFQAYAQQEQTQRAYAIGTEPDIEMEPLYYNPPFVPGSPHSFIEHVKEFAKQAADRLGVDYKAVLGIAALETGWGRHLPQDTKSGISNNYFGIKADKGWSGKQVISDTLENMNGAFEKFREVFRSYDSLADSFQDFAEFLLNNPRYQEALQAGLDTEQFVQRLQQAGYATDPDYGTKVMGVIKHILSIE